MQHISGFICISLHLLKKITTTLKVDRIIHLDVMIFAACTICEHKYQVQLFDPFLLPSLLIIKGNFKNMKSVCVKMLKTWYQDVLISAHVEWSQYSCVWEYRGENRTMLMCVGNGCTKFTSGWRIYKFFELVPSINVFIYFSLSQVKKLKWKNFSSLSPPLSFYVQLKRYGK